MRTNPQLTERPASALVLAAAACLLAAACAAGPRTEVEDAYFQDLGEVTPRALSRAVEGVLVEGRGFELARSDLRYARAFYVTEWNHREPFPDEQAAGVETARSRVLLRGQRADEGVFRVTLEGENEIRTDSIPTWHQAPVTGDFREWMRGIETELRRRMGS